MSDIAAGVLEVGTLHCAQTCGHAESNLKRLSTLAEVSVSGGSFLPPAAALIPKKKKGKAKRILK
jgi:hypothetical protein